MISSSNAVVQVAAEEVAASVQLSDEQRRFLFQTISGPVFAASSSVSTDPSTVQLHLCFVLPRAALMLLADDTQYDSHIPRTAIARFQFEHLKADLQRRALHGAMVCSVLLHSLRLDYLAQGLASPLTMVSPKSALPLSTSISDPLLPTPLPFLTATFETKPQDVFADIKIRLVSQPLEVVFLPDEVLSIAAFFQRKHAKHYHPAQLLDPQHCC